MRASARSIAIVESVVTLLIGSMLVIAKGVLAALRYCVAFLFALPFAV